MRIESISVEAFRGFKEKKHFVFPEADILLLTGPNGYGKTSFFDAIEWGLTGKIFRFEDDSERKQYRYIGNHFSYPKKPSVTIEMKNNEGKKIKIIRTGTANAKATTDCISSKLKIVIDGEFVSDPESILNSILINEDWRNHVDLNKSFFLTHLLSQERMNGILRGMKEKDRYDSISVLFGTEQFMKYKTMFNELKKIIEKNEKEIINNIDRLINTKNIISMEYEKIKEGLSSENKLGNKNNIAELLNLFVRDYDKSWVINENDGYKEVFKKIGEEYDEIKEKILLIQQNEQRDLMLAKYSLTSWKEKQEKYNEISIFIKKLEELLQIRAKKSEILWLNHEVGSFLETRDKLSTIDNQIKALNSNIDENKNLLHMLESLNESLKKALENGSSDNNLYSSLRQQLELGKRKLPEQILSSLEGKLGEFEKSHYYKQEKFELLKEVRSYHTHTKRTLDLLVDQENQYRELLEKVHLYALNQPNSNVCPACGTPNITSNDLIDFVNKRRNELHPDLPELEANVKKIENNLLKKTEEFNQAEKSFEKNLLTLSNLIEKYDKQIEKLNGNNSRNYSSIRNYQKEEQIISASYDKFKEKALKNDLDPTSKAIIEEIRIQLDKQDKVIIQNYQEYSKTETNQLEVSLAGYINQRSKLNDERTLCYSRLDKIGIKIVNDETADFSSIDQSVLKIEKELTRNIESLNKKEKRITKLVQLFKNDKDYLRYQELNKQINEIKSKIENEENNLKLIRSDLSVVAEVIQNVPNALDRLNKKVMGQMFDTMKSIFYRINSHPLFNDIDYDVEQKYNNNRLFLKLKADNLIDDTNANPSYLFSAAQVNATAISFFLAMALRQKWSPLNVVAMDDPVQSMDDLNVMALIDLIRMLTNPAGNLGKQFIISTHDSTFFQLMKKKFRIFNVGVIKYESYSENGPLVSQEYYQANTNKTTIVLTRPERGKDFLD